MNEALLTDKEILNCEAPCIAGDCPIGIGDEPVGLEEEDIRCVLCDGRAIAQAQYDKMILKLRRMIWTMD